MAGDVAPSGTIAYVLEFTEGGSPKQTNLAPGTTVVGRGIGCDLDLGDTSVSRRHAQIVVDTAGCVVTDLGSMNGTYVNGHQIETASLAHGDRVMFGQMQLKFRCSIGHGIAVSDKDSPVSVGKVIRRSITAEHANLLKGATVDAPRLLRLLTDIAHALVAAQSLDQVLNHVVQLAFEATQATRTLLLLHDDATGALVPRVVRHRGDANDSTRISRKILDQVLHERVAMLAMNAQLDPRLDNSQSIVGLDIRSFMCAPLWYEEKIIGVLYVDNPRSHAFTEADLDLFTAFSNYAAIAIAQARLAARVFEETRSRERLERYHSPAVIERILRGEGDEGDLVAHERDVTVLFADLVGFTTMTESMPPQQVAVLLNAFFARMADAVFQHSGTLDKFIGDSVLAIYGAPLDLPNHALNAVRSAQAMRAALAALNCERPDSMLRMRIAIHSGVALVGDIGSPKRREFTVLGDVVNTAARIEENSAGPGQIVTSRVTFERLEGQVPGRSLGLVQLRGRKEPVELFEILPT